MENTPNNKPTHLAFQVQDVENGDESKGRWTEIGAAWMHQDGKGLSINLHSVPLNGRIVLREPSEKPHIEV